MKSVIVYDSVFGNTEKTARLIGEKIVGAEVLKAGEVSWEDVKSCECLVIGSPTRAFKPTPKIMEFLKSIPAGGLNGVRVAVFDTRIDIEKVNSKILKFMEKRFGYAAETIEKVAAKKGGKPVVSALGVFVDESEGPLSAGEEERIDAWAGKVNP